MNFDRFQEISREQKDIEDWVHENNEDKSDVFIHTRFLRWYNLEVDKRNLSGSEQCNKEENK